MDTNKRKLFSRIGAGLMLGLSLFNLGAAMGKEKGGEIPTRAKQIRKREKEQIKPEVQMVANIAEEEAKAVITEQKQVQEETQMQMQTQELSGFQLALRFTVVSVWAVTASVFFSSMIFNYPFALGKALLSLLPGIPHVASLSLDSQAGFYSNQEPIKLYLTLDTNDEMISFTKASIQYDTGALEFYRYEAVGKLFDQLNSTEEEKGKINLFLDTSKKPTKFKKEIVAVLYFRPKESALGPQKISLIKDDSVVLRYDQEKGNKNILGKVASTNFVLNYSDKAEIYCRKIDFNEASLESWQDFTKGTILPEEKNYWVSVDNDRSLLCGLKDNKLYLVFNGKMGDTLSQVNVTGGNKEEGLKAKLAQSWEEEVNKFQVFAFEKNSGFTTGNSLKVELKDRDGQDLKWPARGKGEIKLAN